MRNSDGIRNWTAHGFKSGAGREKGSHMSDQGGSASPFRLSIIAPAYNEEKTIPLFLETLERILPPVTEDYEIIFALDPSSDASERIVEEAHRRNPRVKLLRFSRRFGQPSAVWAGLRHASGDAAIPMDCDMQDPPALIPAMVREWRENGYKVVIPQRRSREGENFLKRAFAYTAYWFINKTASVPIPRNAGDFRLLDRVVIDELMRLHESHGFLRGLTSVVGFSTKLLPFDRQARAAGKTKYLPITGGIGIGFNGVISFSNFLLNAITAAGTVLSMGAIIMAFVLTAAKQFGWYDFAAGVATLTVIVLFLGGAQLMALGVIGSYISRIYDEVKMRPRFIVERSLGFSEAGKAEPGSVS